MTANDKQSEKAFSAVVATKAGTSIVPPPSGRGTPAVPGKSFLTVGPMLHYSHRNVLMCWVLAVAAFVAACFSWSKIVNGTFWSFDIDVQHSTFNVQRLMFNVQEIMTGVSIFEYPWQIVVLGLLMGVLAVVPVLISQLISFRYSLPFILATAFLANLPGFALCLLVSCFGAACRPLRFRSRFIAIALCMAPQLLYWGYFGGAKGLEPLKWGFSFAPWVCAWFDALCIAGIVILIGHFTRYRPGVVWIVTGMVVLIAVVLFEVKIGFDELDYQFYVAKNNPDNINEFHDHSITEALDKTITDPGVKKYLARFFYPVDPIALRAELKRELQVQLSYDRWPSWFIVPQELMYQTKKQWLLEHYDLFINKRPQSRRMPIALYYKALLSEYSPDIRLLGEKETLHFYNDYPHREFLLIWSRLYESFPESSESLEARWRIARDWAGVGRLEQAEKVIAEAQEMLTKRLQLLEEEQPQEVSSLSGLFHPPAASAMTAFKLNDLQRRLNQLRLLIGTENRSGEKGADERLAKFVMLNPYISDYGQHLDELLRQSGAKDGLSDNILLAQTKLIADEQLQAQNLSQLHQEFPQTDGGMQALYELGLLKISMWRQQQQDTNPELKKKYLTQARAALTSFISLYPDSFYAELAKKNLENLPKVD